LEEITKLIIALVGGGSVTGIITALITKQKNDSEERFDMIDRLLKEIDRLDEVIIELRERIKEAQNEKIYLETVYSDKYDEEEELRQTVINLEKEVASLRNVLEEYRREGKE